MLYLHGGGHFCLTGRSHLEYVARLVQAHRKRGTRCRACVVDTRRAPEHPYPAQLDDALASYRFLLRTYDSSQIFVAGDSAGGGLSLSTLKAIRDQGLPAPACATVISPWTDVARGGGAHEDCPETDYIPPEAMEYACRGYSGAEDPKHPLMSPKYGHMHALPPVLIQSGESELLAKDSVECARRLEVYRSKVRLEMYRDMPHVFPMLCALGLEEARTAIERQSEFVADVLAGGDGSDKSAVASDLLVSRSSSDLRTMAPARRLPQVASVPAMSPTASGRALVAAS